jgi:hypothetical protein
MNEEQNELTKEELDTQKIQHLNLLLSTTQTAFCYIAGTNVIPPKATPGERSLYYLNGVSNQINSVIDYRSPLPNELIFEIDSKQWKKVKEAGDRIIDLLNEFNIPFNLAASGGKGVHISVFFKIIFTDKIKSLLSEAIKKDYKQKYFRRDLLKYFVQLAGYKSIDMGTGKLFDSSCIEFNDNEFNDFENQGKLIRIIGGRKAVFNDEGLQWNYKKCIDEIPLRKNDLHKRLDINFPNRLKIWNIDENVTLTILKRYVEIAKKSTKFDYTVSKIEGGFCNLSCVKSALNNIKEGLRNRLTYVFTYACRCDGLNKEECKQKLEEFYTEFYPNKSTFGKHEMCSWLSSIYDQWENNFNYAHSVLVKEGYCDGNCEFTQTKYQKIVDFLNKEDILANVITVIQQKIKGREYVKVIGEEINILHLFLTYLSAYTKDPQNRNLEGDTSSGKSFTTTSVLNFFPYKDKITVAGMSKKAIYYDAKYNSDRDRLEYCLNNKMITLLEESESFEFLKEIKPILSHDMNEIQYKVTVEKNKQKVTETIYIIGWPCYVGLSVLVKHREREQESREWTISINESKTKFEKTTLNLAKCNPFVSNLKHPDTLILKEAIKYLKPLFRNYDVYVPFLEDVLIKFNSGDSRVQRDVIRFKSMIELVAKLHIYQRNILFNDEVKSVIAEPIDIYYAFGICQESIQPLFSGLLTKHYRYFKDLFNDSCEYSLEDICDKFNKLYNKTMGKYNFKILILDKFLSVNIVKEGTDEQDKRKKVYSKNEQLSKDFEDFFKVKEAILCLLKKQIIDIPITKEINNLHWGVLKNKRLVEVPNPYFTNFKVPIPVINNILFDENYEKELHTTLKEKTDNTLTGFGLNEDVPY